jgi:hypothetical protein
MPMLLTLHSYGARCFDRFRATNILLLRSNDGDRLGPASVHTVVVPREVTTEHTETTEGTRRRNARHLDLFVSP